VQPLAASEPVAASPVAVPPAPLVDLAWYHKTVSTVPTRRG
jgi:hypothetical protein